MGMKLRILIVSQYFWPENFRVNDLTLALVERGHSVTVLTGLPNYPAGKLFPGYRLFQWPFEDFHGAKIVRSPLLPRGNNRGVRLALNYFSFALFSSIVGPLLCRGKFDKIFVFEPSPVTVGIPAIIMKFFKKAPVFFWVLDLWPESLSATGAVRSKKIIGLVGKMTALIYRHCDRILVQSKGFIPHVQRLNVPAQKIRYFPNWAEALYEPRAEVNVAEFDQIPDGFRILFAGNIGEAQDFPTILDAAEIVRKSNPAIQWVIAGAGRNLDWLKSEVKRRSLHTSFFFVGSLPQERMPDLFRAADCLLVSLKDEEIFNVTIPGKLQAYLACGRPLLGSLNGTGGEVILEANAGHVAPAENPAELAKMAISLAALSSEKRDAMGAAGRAYYLANFERSRQISNLERILEEEA